LNFKKILPIIRSFEGRFPFIFATGKNTHIHLSEAFKIKNEEVNMGILSWIILGLVVGIIAKLLMPGKDPGGIFMTIILGVAGAIGGGFISSAIGFGKVTGFDLRSLIIAVGGSVLLLVIYRKFKK
jgi:uncharacterized membrane protein YeaQ/YmgE (transglycosylase-associated protein family)